MLAGWLEKHLPRDTDVTQTFQRIELEEPEPEEAGRPFFIRPAESRDMDEVLALLSLIPANRDLDIEWSEVALRFREANSLEIFVAEALEQDPPLIIGFIAMSIVRGLTEGRGLINDMAVLPTYQRRGVGSALFEAVLRRADRLNLRSIMVNTQRANDRVRAFYSALGFAQSEIMHLKLK
jgi:ribosomal protein S18 acetylase RimI-like enzyme